MSMSFQTSNSGAFRSLHCLIYKVLAPLRSVAEHSLSYHTLLSLSSTFFDFFQNLFSYPLALVSRLIALLSYHTLSNLSSPFLNFFQSFFGACLALQVSLRKLDYLNTSAPVCQPFFSLSRKLFFKSLSLARLCQTACIIYQMPPLLSIPFPLFF